MPKEGLTEIVCVLDRSGSMDAIIDDAIGGFNSFLKSQKEVEDGECKMTIAMFDDQYEIICTSKNVEDVEEFNRETYVPRGMTALNDAIGKTITTLGEVFRKRKENKKPEKVIFVVLTDGHENSSEEYKLDKIKELVKQQEEEWSWEFIFLSSNIDAFSQGHNYGFKNTTRMAKSGEATFSAYNSLSSAVTNYRTTGDLGEIERNIE